jgi:translation initiation factor 2B subunit (eIF-2B alpha/beta/delta family)
MRDRHRALVDAIRADDSSGATEIVTRAAGLLLDLLGVSSDQHELSELARACAEAQPTMAGLFTLEALARTAPDPASSIRRFQEQVRRAPAAIARQAAPLLLLGPDTASFGRPALRLVTCSSSRAVESTLLAVAHGADLTVCCAESRPKREGIDLAGRLAASGVAVQLFSDAGISAVVQGSDGILSGADAVGPEFFLNKVGTAAICALASSHGVPVYVVAGREKLLSGADMGRLVIVEGPSEQLIEAPPPGVVVRNPYFERISLGLVTLIVTDADVRPAQP